jgi:hypothetical protein
MVFHLSITLLNPPEVAYALLLLLLIAELGAFLRRGEPCEQLAVKRDLPAGLMIGDEILPLINMGMDQYLLIPFLGG